MAQPVLADTLLTQIAELERRLVVLERTPRVPQITTSALGIQADLVGTFQTTTSTSFADLATVGPTVPAMVGPAGRVLLWGGAFAFASDTNLTADVGLSVDGAAADAAAGLENNFGGSGGTSQAFGRVLEDLLPGEHTFQLKYKSSSGIEVGFQDRWLVALPL